MAYLREVDREPRPASRDPVVAHEPGAAALQPWQAAVIAGLQAGLTAVVACAEARVSVRQFRESYTRDLLFRDACLAAIAAARAAADEVLAPARALPPWAPALFGVLLKGVSLEAAYAKVGVTAAESGTYTDFANINLAGLLPDGSDGASEVTHLLLDVIDEMHLLQPSSNVQVSRKTPDRVLRHVLRVVRKGYGFPSLFNADAVVEEQLR